MYSQSGTTTLYNNCLFRSRLEARWAVFFDKLGVKWEYEKPSPCIGYTPDFWLPEVGLWDDESEPGIWVEIKPNYDSVYVNEFKFDTFGCDGTPLIVFIGESPGFIDYYGGYEYTSAGRLPCTRIVKCCNPVCGYVRVTYCKNKYKSCPRCFGDVDDLQPDILEAAFGDRSDLPNWLRRPKNKLHKDTEFCYRVPSE